MGLLALEQARVQAILRRAEQLEQRCGLRDIVDAERASAGERRLELAVQPIMDRLALARTDAAEAHGRRQRTAQPEVEERRERFVAIDAERTRDEAERRCEVAVELVACEARARVDKHSVAEAARGDVEQRTALRTTRARRDVTPQRRAGERIELGEPGGIVVRGTGDR